MFLVLIIILTNIDFTYCQQDISFGKPFITCGSETKVLTDGDRRTIHTFRSNATCNISFKFPPSYGNFLKYMIIFTGETGSVSTPRHNLDYLEVLCGQENYEYLCAAPSTRINKIKHMENGVRVNFVYETDVGRHLRFSKKIAEVNLSEIEVYARAGPIHRGCFTTVFSNQPYNFSGFKQCQSDCYLASFGISKPLKRCLCTILNYKNELPLSKCNSKCHDSNERCGGDNSYSVYINAYHLPAYSGCRDKASFLVEVSRGEVKLDIPIRNLTFSKCVRYCGRSHSFFSNGNCSCAVWGAVIFVDHKSLCDNPCAFNEEVVCGGESTVSVYQACNTFNIVPCEKLLNCKRAIFDHHGVCTHGCKSGFEGKHCLLKTSDSTPGEIEELDEEIELDDRDIIVIPPVTQESTASVNSPNNQDDNIEITVINKSERRMVDYNFSIWIAIAGFLSILF